MAPALRPPAVCRAVGQGWCWRRASWTRAPPSGLRLPHAAAPTRHATLSLSPSCCCWDVCSLLSQEPVHSHRTRVPPLPTDKCFETHYGARALDADSPGVQRKCRVSVIQTAAAGGRVSSAPQGHPGPALAGVEHAGAVTDFLVQGPAPVNSRLQTAQLQNSGCTLGLSGA